MIWDVNKHEYVESDIDSTGSIDAITVNGTPQTIEDKTAKIVVDKSTVGLGNVNNTSDANKPISTATQTALNEKLDKTAVVNVTAEAVEGQVADAKSVYDTIQALPSGADISLGLTSASVGDIIKVKAVDANGKPTEWEAAEQIGKVRLLTTVTTDANASEIEIEGLNITSLPVSIRIKNTGSSCGTGLNISINGTRSIGYAGTLSTTESSRAEVRAWLLDNGIGGVIGKSIMKNNGTNNYSWSIMPSIINTLAIGNPYHDGETKYFSAGTIVEIWEGVFPNVP